jgi:hypothetical protein
MTGFRSDLMFESKNGGYAETCTRKKFKVQKIATKSIIPRSPG